MFDHPHLIQITDLFVADNTVYIVDEYCQVFDGYQHVTLDLLKGHLLTIPPFHFQQRLLILSGGDALKL